MKISLLSLLIIVFSVVAFSQGKTGDYYNGGDSVKVSDPAVSFELTTGAGVSSGANGGTAFTTYIAPYVSYRLSERWKVGVGAALINADLDRWKSYSFGDYPSTSGTITDKQIFIRANYQASENIIISGAIYHSLMSMQSPDGEITPFSPGLTSYALGMQYKLAKGLTLGVEFRQSRGSMYQSPFYYPFPSRFGTFGTW